MKLLKKKQWIKLFYYCVKFIAKFMKIFFSYINRSWEIFEKKMRKEYKDQDIEQMINFRLFLKKFKNKVKKNNQMHIYSRQFRNISIKLIKWKQLNIYIQCSWYLQKFSNFYRIKLIRKHNFNFSDFNIMIFELVYKIVIVMIDINDALWKLNVLSSKENKDSIDKLIDLIKTNQKTNKSFSSETTFASSVLSAISTKIIFKKIIEFFIEIFKIMHFNNARAIIVDEVQKIVNVILYRQSVALLINISIDFKQISIQIV